MEQTHLQVQWGAAARPWCAAVADLAAAVFAEPPYGLPASSVRLGVTTSFDHYIRHDRGLVLVTASAGDELIGFTYGVPLSTRTRWWDRVETPLPPGFTAETGSRTYNFALTAVTPRWRPSRIGRRILDTAIDTVQRARAERITFEVQAGTIAARMFHAVGAHSLGEHSLLPGRPRSETLVLNVADYRR